MKLEFGLSTMIYYQEPIAKLLPHLKNSEITNIEIRPKSGHFQPQKLEEVIKLKNKLEKTNIFVKSIHMPMNGVDLSHPQEYDRIKSVREVEKTILMAFHLGADFVVVHPGAMVNNFDDKENRLKLSIESLKEIVEFSQEWKIKVALENTPPGRVGDKWEEIQQIIEIVSSENIGICLDTGHYLLNYHHYLHNEINLDHIPVDWQKKLIHIHIHDNNGKQDLHLLPTEGIFPWPSFMNFIRKINYKGILVFELKEQYELRPYLDRINNIFEEM